ncbi:MAG: hypothetical protein M3N93_13700 [Acidobacteriota bacterium]|nr:hypothetical protein [Acidobacteriota bacterium]
MEVHLSRDAQAKPEELARQNGRTNDEMLSDALSIYYDQLASTRQMLDQRYDDLENGNVGLIDGEAFFETLRRREDELLKKSRR